MSDKNKLLLTLLGIRVPIIQAPMALADSPALARAVSAAGGLGSMACAMLTPEQVQEEYLALQRLQDIPVNLNFFCHRQVEKSAAQQQKWLRRLMPYYLEYKIDPMTVNPAPARVPFNDAHCKIIEEIRPPVVSFHFGLPSQELVRRVKATGAIILSSATTVEEGVWLEKHGCDIVIAQGKEAGGHRGMFLTSDLSTQITTRELVSLLARKISLPIVAAGGIADGESIQQAFSWGASAVQLGTAFLFCEEARVATLHRKALTEDQETVLTNLYTGRPARGIVTRFINEVGPVSAKVPDFPYAADYVNPLRKAAEAVGSSDFMPLWSGEVRKPHTLNAAGLMRELNSAIKD